MSRKCKASWFPPEMACKLPLGHDGEHQCILLEPKRFKRTGIPKIRIIKWIDPKGWAGPWTYEELSLVQIQRIYIQGILQGVTSFKPSDIPGILYKSTKKEKRK